MKNNRINDIAAKAGVSVSTVSRVFNNRPYVKEELRKRVLEVAVDMDYTPKSMARRDTISVVISRSDDFVANNYERSLANRFFAAASSLNLNLEFIPLDHIKRVYQFVRIMKPEFTVQPVICWRTVTGRLPFCWRPIRKACRGASARVLKATARLCRSMESRSGGNWWCMAGPGY